MADPVPLVLYKNGLLMFAGPFREYAETTTQVGRDQSRHISPLPSLPAQKILKPPHSYTLDAAA